MDKYILDTNLFFNMAAGINLGGTTEQVIELLTNVVKRTKKESIAEFYMPPKIVDEFLSFFENKNQEFIQEFLSHIHVKTPDINVISIHASIFYLLINDVRTRSYRGLQIAEEEIEEAGKLMMGQEQLDKKNFQIKIGSVVKKFRERYRQATRFGFLDSVADLDVIMLAKELNGILVSTDEGVAQWGRLFGVKEMAPDVFGQKMRQYAR